MSNVTETVPLDLGIVVAGIHHLDAELRAARLADIYSAAAAVAVPSDISTDESARIAYQMAVDDAQVLAQIAKLGDLDPLPSLQVLIAEIDPDDMALLRAAAERLKKKLRQSKPGLPPIVEPSTSSSEPALT